MDCQATVRQPSQGYGWCWLVKPTLFKRLEKEGITRWDGSGRVQHIRAFILFRELHRNTALCQTVLRKLRPLRNQKVEITAACSQDTCGCWHFAGYYFVSLCVCVCEGVAKGPARQREARENTNEAGQKSHRHTWMREFLALGAGMEMGHGTLKILCQKIKFKKRIYSKNSLPPIFVP